MIKTICYISDSIKHESIDKLKSLYQKASVNNKKQNITGVLIYKNSNFLQVLEGEASSVDQTFNKIQEDKRHRNIFKVISTQIEQRIFEDYNFGFTIVDNKQALNDLYQYLEWLREADSPYANKVILMVENFINSN
ncbi:BLUF domain-containing protein [Flavisericum labens]|uniref:BLUF domain-containing protein n=1 Tax=Flavisericum labens TaxID=3377112 RepID=UPI00387B96AF